MSTYTDLFVVPVPKKNTKAYRKQAELFHESLERARRTVLH